MSISIEKPYDVFQKGLIRGGASLAYDPIKEYFYVEHPTEGWRVYLRACCFLHEKPRPDECIDYSKFLVVKRAGANSTEKSWEPPKGQMEAKDGLRHKSSSVMELLRENVKREVGEEARVTTIQGLRHSGLVLQGRESDYPSNHFFQYHIFQGIVPHSTFLRATTELDWYRAHPAAFARLKRDKREKDALDWYSPSDHKLMGKWSPRIVANYLMKFT